MFSQKNKKSTWCLADRPHRLGLMSECGVTSLFARKARYLSLTLCRRCIIRRRGRHQPTESR
ncbi:hypothetical protein M413DRAFT_157553 [Hebeloma cylindrosporum]|uniref:Uncharacterized protein n=1 Tax=Hebeloma cylindrosporum TaxID=76867 RepID=A0A0C3C9S8_HEBCY|nr:hypothetical protein M413DRAFT_157553 [Hebeloma cylindrosporum h7]